MNLQFKREGGFIGRTRVYTQEVSTLPQELQSTLQKLFDKGIEVKAAPVPNARDVFHYVLQLSNDGVTRTFEFNELEIPGEVSELLKYLNRQLKPY